MISVVDNIKQLLKDWREGRVPTPVFLLGGLILILGIFISLVTIFIFIESFRESWGELQALGFVFFLFLALLATSFIKLGIGILCMKTRALYGYAVLVTLSLWVILSQNFEFSSFTTVDIPYLILAIIFVIPGSFILWFYRKQFK